MDRHLRKTEVKYKTIEREIIEAPDWPPIDKTTEGMANGYMRLDSVNSVQGVSVYHTSDSESDIKSLASVSSQKVATNKHLNCANKSAFNQGSLPCIMQNSNDASSTTRRQTGKSRTLSESAVDDAEAMTNDESLLSDEITSLAHARSRDKVSTSSHAIPLIDPPPGRKKTFGSQEDVETC
jgi:hypothetical protein